MLFLFKRTLKNTWKLNANSWLYLENRIKFEIWKFQFQINRYSESNFNKRLWWNDKINIGNIQ